MTYVEGFLTAVPVANKDEYVAHATSAADMIKRNGATRFVETWGDDVPRGTQTDFYRAVEAKDDETVAFSWVEWPDKATRDAGMQKMMEDPRMDPSNKDNPPMPFDGQRMVFGGFTPVVELRA